MPKLVIKNRYATVPNNLIENPNISLKAKGLYAYIQSKPDGWDFSAERISKSCKEGLDSVRMGLIELENAGYLQRIKSKDEKGLFSIEYVLHEYSALDFPTSDNPTLDFPTLENTQNHNKKDLSKKDNNKKDNNRAFSFFDSLLAIAGAENESLVKDFMLVRKNKKATNSETAFNLFKNECAKSGRPVSEILTTCISRDWKSFKADWLNPQKPTFQQIAPQKPKSTAQDILSERNIG
jgi:hypothetical protein